jgi:transposase
LVPAVLPIYSTEKGLSHLEASHLGRQCGRIESEPKRCEMTMREKLFTLTRSQREELWRRYKQTADRRVAERLHAILLLDEGRSVHDVSAILHVHPKTLKRWIRTFATAGIDGLCTFHYVGNTTSLSPPQIHQLTAWLDAQIRSTKEAIAWVHEQFGFDYTESGMLKLLKRLDYRYKQPAQVPSKADREAQAAWLETYAEKRGP